MEINLSQEQEARIRALALAKFRTTLDAAEADVAAGRGHVITPETAQIFANDLKRRARERWGRSRADQAV